MSIRDPPFGRGVRGAFLPALALSICFPSRLGDLGERREPPSGVRGAAPEKNISQMQTCLNFPPIFSKKLFLVFF